MLASASNCLAELTADTVLEELICGDLTIIKEPTSVLSGPDKGRLLERGTFVFYIDNEKDRVRIAGPVTGWVKLKSIASIHGAVKLWEALVEREPSSLVSAQYAYLLLETGDKKRAADVIRDIKYDCKTPSQLSVLAFSVSGGTRGYDNDSTKNCFRELVNARDMSDYCAALFLREMVKAEEMDMCQLIVDANDGKREAASMYQEQVSIYYMYKDEFKKSSLHASKAHRA